MKHFFSFILSLYNLATDKHRNSQIIIYIVCVNLWQKNLSLILKRLEWFNYDKNMNLDLY